VSLCSYVNPRRHCARLSSGGDRVAFVRLSTLQLPASPIRKNSVLREEEAEIERERERGGGGNSRDAGLKISLGIYSTVGNSRVVPDVRIYIHNTEVFLFARRSSDTALRSGFDADTYAWRIRLSLSFSLSLPLFLSLSFSLSLSLSLSLSPSFYSFVGSSDGNALLRLVTERCPTPLLFQRQRNRRNSSRGGCFGFRIRHFPLACSPCSFFYSFFFFNTRFNYS